MTSNLRERHFFVYTFFKKLSEVLLYNKKDVKSNTGGAL